jgi:hypothetical protein
MSISFKGSHQEKANVRRKHMSKQEDGPAGTEMYTYDIPLTVTAFEAGLRRR